MDARFIPYESVLDVIGAFDVLEHIQEDEMVLQQIFKSLKLGGVAVITVPQHKWLWSEVDDYACHVRRYEPQDLHEKITKAGFVILKSTSFVSLLMPALYFSRFSQRKKIRINDDCMAELQINPILNKILEVIMMIEFYLIRLGINFSLGGSRLVVVLKPQEGFGG